MIETNSKGFFTTNQWASSIFLHLVDLRNIYYHYDFI